MDFHLICWHMSSFFWYFKGIIDFFLFAAVATCPQQILEFDTMINAGGCLCTAEGVAVGRHRSHLFPEPKHHAASHAYPDGRWPRHLLWLIPVPYPCRWEVISCHRQKWNRFLMSRPAPVWLCQYYQWPEQRLCCIHYSPEMQHPSSAICGTILHHWFQAAIVWTGAVAVREMGKETVDLGTLLGCQYCSFLLLHVCSNVVVKKKRKEKKRKDDVRNVLSFGPQDSL